MTGSGIPAFHLDPRIAADTLEAADWPLNTVRLMNDRQFVWLILVPKRPGLAEIHDLAPADLALLGTETARAARALAAAVRPDKINVGALGNIVRQLHVHVVARRTTDAAWPGPVWGSGAPVPYADDGREILASLQPLLTAPEI